MSRADALGLSHAPFSYAVPRHANFMHAARVLGALLLLFLGVLLLLLLLFLHSRNASRKKSKYGHREDIDRASGARIGD